MANNDPRFRLEVGKFNAAMRDMQARLKNQRTMQEVVDYEVSKIVETALARTDAATVNSIRDSQKTRLWATVGEKKYKLTNRYSNAVWKKIEQARKDSFLRKIAARGLAKKAWLNLARLIGFDISSPGYVRSAKRRGGGEAGEGSSVQRSVPDAAYGLTITQNSPLNPWASARQAFFSAVVGRRKFFEQNLARGVFRDMAAAAKKYPGLVVKGP